MIISLKENEAKTRTARHFNSHGKLAEYVDKRAGTEKRR
jgi:hypothetical protein